MDLAKGFFDLFKGLNRAYGLVELGEVDRKKNKRSGKFQTVRGEYNKELWQLHLDGKQSFGVVPINDEFECSFGAIDIDEYNGLDVDKIEHQIAINGLPLVPCRTKSGGLHLYLFTTEPVTAALMRSKLTEISIYLGFKGVEIFPKQIHLASKDDIGNWLNMPYFNKDDTQRPCIFNGKPVSAERFLELAKKKKVTLEQLHSIETPKTAYTKDGPVCLERIERENGIKEGGRNKAVFGYGTYAKRAFPDNWEESIEDFNRQLVIPPLNSKEVQTIIGSLKKKDYVIPCSEDPFASRCHRGECLTRKYGISGAVNDIGISINALVKIESVPPTWCIDIDGKRIDSLDTDVIKNQEYFRKLCMENLNILPTKVKTSVWDAIIQDLLKNKIEILPAPVDTSHHWQIRHLVDRFITEYSFSTRKEDLLEGNSVYCDGKIYFSSSSLLKFLEKEKFPITAHKLYALLRKIDCLYGEWNIKKKCVRWWSLPFDGQILTFEQPELEKAEF